VLSPELYIRSLHQLNRIVAIDIHVFTLVEERNPAFGIHLAGYTEVFVEKPVCVPLRPDLW
jgi:hypothetical protein